MARLSARAEPTRSDTKPRSEGRCQHISAVGFGRLLPGARGIKRRPRGTPDPSSAPARCSTSPVLCVYRPQQGEGQGSGYGCSAGRAADPQGQSGPTWTDVNTIVRPLLCGVRGFGGRSGCSLVWRFATV